MKRRLVGRGTPRPRIVKTSITPHYAIVGAIFVSKRRQNVAPARVLVKACTDFSSMRSFCRADANIDSSESPPPRARGTFVLLKPVVNNDELVPPCDYMRACPCRSCVCARAPQSAMMTSRRISKLATFRDVSRHSSLDRSIDRSIGRWSIRYKASPYKEERSVLLARVALHGERGGMKR